MHRLHHLLWLIVMKSSYRFRHCASSKNGESSDNSIFGNTTEAGFEAPSTETTPASTFSSVSPSESMADLV